MLTKELSKLFRYLFLFLFLIKSQIIFAQAILKEDSAINYKNKLIVLPLVFYTPETKLAFGGIGIFLFKAGHDLKTRTSNFDFVVVHTTNGQTIVEPTYTIYTKGERFYMRGTEILSLKANELLYVPGNRTHKHLDAHEVTYNSIKFNNSFLFRVAPFTYFGIKQQFNNPYNIIIDKKTQKYGQKSYDSAFSVASGIGPALLYDTRDNIVNPFKGFFVDLGLTFFNKCVRSVKDFNNIFLDARAYKQWNPKGTLAFNTILNFNIGEYPPLQQLGSLGGGTVLRGFYRGRYKERHAIVFQTEYRQHIYKNFGVTVFAGIGEVAKTMNEFRIKGINYSYGTGLRYMINKTERLNIRLDFGFGNNDSHGIYAGISEAF